MKGEANMMRNGVLRIVLSLVIAGALSPGVALASPLAMEGADAGPKATPSPIEIQDSGSQGKTVYVLAG